MAAVGELLEAAVARLRTSGSETPRLDAEVLLGWAVGVDRTVLIAHPEAPVGADAGSTFERALVRRERGEPVAYIRGIKEFYGLAFSVDARALIPRPETELLVDLLERDAMHRLTSGVRDFRRAPLRVADVGTGSGAVAVTFGVLLRRQRVGSEVDVIATEASPDALALARENAVAHAVADRIRFVEADLLPPVVDPPLDLVAANLPYVQSGAIGSLPVAASFEPLAALDGGPDGLTVIARLLARLPEALAPDGAALLEIGADQAEAVRDLVTERLPGWDCIVRHDLAGLPRVARVAREMGTAEGEGASAAATHPGPGASATGAAGS